MPLSIFSCIMFSRSLRTKKSHIKLESQLIFNEAQHMRVLMGIRSVQKVIALQSPGLKRSA